MGKQTIEVDVDDDREIFRVTRGKTLIGERNMDELEECWMVHTRPKKKLCQEIDLDYSGASVAKKIDIEVPDGKEIGQVTTSFYSADGCHCGCHGTEYVNVHCTLVPKWEYPEWLGGAGVAMDAGGFWWVYEEKPWPVRTSWHYHGDASEINFLFPLWTPPHCDDWRNSWHPNPRK